MKKTAEMRAEYRREDLGDGVRGKHCAEFAKGSNLVMLPPELSKVFPNNAAVIAALNSLVEVARSATAKSLARPAASARARSKPVAHGV